MWETFSAFGRSLDPSLQNAAGFGFESRLTPHCAQTWYLGPRQNGQVGIGRERDKFVGDFLCGLNPIGRRLGRHSFEQCHERFWDALWSLTEPFGSIEQMSLEFRGHAGIACI